MNETRFRESERRLWASVGVAPAEKHLRLDRTKATVRVQEVGEGQAVLFVHGASNGGTSWAGLAARLDGFRCVLLDRPGCGLSDRCATGFTDMATLGVFGDSLIVDVLDALGLDCAHVVATSFGGYFALRGAAAHPDRIGRAVELGWTFGAPIAKVPLVMRLSGMRLVRRLVTLIPPNERVVRAMLRQIGLAGALASGRFSQTDVDWSLALLRDTNTLRNELETSPRLITPLRGMNRSTLLPDDLLTQIRTPMHFLWGVDDPFGGPDIARAFVERVPKAGLELMPGAGHAVWMDDPDRAAASVRAFLGAGPGEPSPKRQASR